MFESMLHKNIFSKRVPNAHFNFYSEPSRAKLVKVATPFIMRFAAKTKTESLSPDSN